MYYFHSLFDRWANNYTYKIQKVMPETWPTWPLRGEERTRTGRMSRGREGASKKPGHQHLRASAARVSGPARSPKVDVGPGAQLLPGWGVRKKSIMRWKDHFVTLIFFLLRRQIFYSTSFFFFFFCKNGIHEPIQNANGTYGYGISYTVTSFMYTLKTELA